MRPPTRLTVTPPTVPSRLETSAPELVHLAPRPPWETAAPRWEAPSPRAVRTVRPRVVEEPALLDDSPYGPALRFVVVVTAVGFGSIAAALLVSAAAIVGWAAASVG